MRPRRPRLVRRVALARRLAAGLAPAQAARAARCPVDLVEALLGEDEFQEIVQGWQELLALAPAVRTERLTKLAQLVLEEALERRSLPAALFTLAHAFRGRDPVRAVVGGLERAVQHAGAEAARAAADPPPATLPAQAPPPATAAPAPAAGPGPRPDRLAALCQRTGAALRAAIVVEQGRAAHDPARPPSAAADPLGTAVHALHRLADAAARPPAAPPAAPPARVDPPPGPAAARAAAVDALTDQLLAQLATAGPAQRLALARLDDQALDRLARTLLSRPPPPGPAQPGPAKPQGP